ncbi:efflux RND transporter periplasmic adaptor subunit [Elusimicrobium posterum]|uniref:efflux RND transporter periplasmic adaptor subunit n=1 Tax=Elusimicrobium posterum TaxID=3116653 RepID=UPI003C75AE1F
MQKLKQNKIIAGVITAVVLIIVALVVFLINKPGMPDMVMPATEVGVITLKAESYPLEQELTGRVKPSMQSDVRPQVDGIIQERLFKEGEYVKAGEVLYKLDSATYQASYNQAAAALKSAQANIQAAKLKAERYADLIKHNGVSRQDYDDAQASYQQALASVEEKKAAAETARINLERTEIKAPISGYIGISSVTPGALVNANQSTALATIRELNPIYVDMTQSSAQIVKLRLLPQNDSISRSQTIGVKLKFEDGTIYQNKGELQLQEVAIEESTGTVTLRAQFPNPDGLLMPGMYVRTLVNGAHVNDGILIKQQAVSFDPKGNATVYVVNSENKVEQRTIKTGPAMGDKWPVIEGLKANERVIVEGTNKVRAGADVNAVEVSYE